MPQFRPYWWLNLLSWSFLLLFFLTWLMSSHFFPSLLTTNYGRIFIIFTPLGKMHLFEQSLGAQNSILFLLDISFFYHYFSLQ
jgi:hypothetical protein